MRRNNIKLAGAYRTIASSGRCTYCGVSATTKDHVIPISVAAALADIGRFSDNLRIKVPACVECNSIAGGKLFSSVGAKRRYIQSRLRKKYGHILCMPSWTEEELEKLGWNLKTSVQQGLDLKKWIRARLGFVHHVVVPTNRNGTGKGFVQTSAAMNTIAPKSRRLLPPSARINCLRCGKDAPARRSDQKFCSPQCRSKFHNEKFLHRLHEAAKIIAAYEFMERPRDGDSVKL